MVEQNRDRQEIQHADGVDHAPGARVRANEQGVSTLKETVDNEEERSARGRRPRTVFAVGLVLSKSLETTSGGSGGPSVVYLQWL